MGLPARYRWFKRVNFDNDAVRLGLKIVMDVLRPRLLEKKTMATDDDLEFALKRKLLREAYELQ